MRRFKRIFVNLAVISLVFGAYGLFLFYNQGKMETDQAIIYLIKATPTDFQLVPVERQIEGAQGPAQAVQALLKGPLTHEKLSPSVPKSARMLDLSVHDSLATVNFSPEIVSDFPGGLLMEAYLVEAIVNTLTEFPTIERVQILVDGGIVESIGGHVLILQPLQRRD